MWRMVVGLASTTLLLLCACGDLDSGTSSGGGDTVSIGEAARDGKFEFMVNDVSCGDKTIGSNFSKTKAQGEFCIVDLTVENVGEEAQSMFADNQYLYAGSKRFSADSDAMFIKEAQKLFFDEINPGNTLDGVVIFDVPTDVTPDRLELHDSAFSGGINVEV